MRGNHKSPHLTTSPKVRWKGLVGKVWYFIPKQILEIVCGIKLSICTQSRELTLSEMVDYSRIETKLLRHSFYFVLCISFFFLQWAFRFFWLFWRLLFNVFLFGMYLCTALPGLNNFFEKYSLDSPRSRQVLLEGEKEISIRFESHKWAEEIWEA